MNHIANITKAARSVNSWLRATCTRLGEQVVSALVWLLLCGGAGAALIVTGVWLLAGSGWACIVAGTFLLFAAGIIFRGLNA